MEIYRSRPNLFARFLVISGIFALGYILGVVRIVDLPQLRFAGWLLMAICAVAGSTLLFHLLRGGLCIRVNDEGFHDTRWGIGVIPWTEVQSTGVHRFSNLEFLYLALSDEEKWFQRMPFWRRAEVKLCRKMGVPHFAVSLAGTTGKIDPLRAEIDEYLTEPDSP